MSLKQALQFKQAEERTNSVGSASADPTPGSSPVEPSTDMQAMVRQFREAKSDLEAAKIMADILALRELEGGK